MRRDGEDCIGSGNVPLHLGIETDYAGLKSGRCPICFARLPLITEGVMPPHAAAEREIGDLPPQLVSRRAREVVGAALVPTRGTKRDAVEGALRKCAAAELGQAVAAAVLLDLSLRDETADRLARASAERTTEVRSR